MYLWEIVNWPNFVVDAERLAVPLRALSQERGRLIGRLQAMGMDAGEEYLVDAMVNDVVSTSQIEGESLDARRVRSSVARRLGLEGAELIPTTSREDGPVNMLADAVQNFADPLTEVRLCAWHSVLFTGNVSPLQKILVGQYRDDSRGEMQIVSGPDYKSRVHYVAPPADRLADEMEQLLGWVEARDEVLDPVIKAGIAHLWFELVHPFEDGNGRIGRAIVDLLLCRAAGSSYRYYRLPEQMMRDRRRYYSELESAGKQNHLDITRWLLWFVAAMAGAVAVAHEQIDDVITRAQFWEKYDEDTFNPRQRKVIAKLLDNFEGKLSTTKWAKICQCSQDTATRDLADLIDKGIMVKTGGGRSTRYWLADQGPETSSSDTHL